MLRLNDRNARTRRRITTPIVVAFEQNDDRIRVENDRDPAHRVDVALRKNVDALSVSVARVGRKSCTSFQPMRFVESYDAFLHEH